MHVVPPTMIFKYWGQHSVAAVSNQNTTLAPYLGDRMQRDSTVDQDAKDSNTMAIVRLRPYATPSGRSA